MGIGDIMEAISITITMIIAYPAFLILLNLLFGKTTTRVAERLEQGMKISFFVGLLVVGIGAFLVITLVSAGSVLQLIGFILYLLLSFWGTIGNAGLARVFGARLSDMSERKTSPLYELLSGGFVITLSFAFPLVGWFVLMPIVSVITIGAMTLNLFTRKQRVASDDVSDIIVPS